MQTAGRFNTSQSVHHFTAVSARVVRLRIFDGQRRFVVPEEHLVFATRINFTYVFEPLPTIHAVQTVRYSATSDYILDSRAAKLS